MYRSAWLPMPSRWTRSFVTSERQIAALERAGFYERRRHGFGTFLDRADIERRRPSRTVDLLTGIAGVRIQYNRDGSRSVMMRSLGFRGACRPRILLDGIEVRWFNLDHDLSPHDVEAVEIYRGSVQTPARFGGTNSSCGVLVFWTRR
jgi:hypothetical protein